MASDTIGSTLIVGPEFVIGAEGGEVEPEPGPGPGPGPPKEEYKATQLGQELYNALLPLTYT